MVFGTMRSVFERTHGSATSTSSSNSLTPSLVTKTISKSRQSPGQGLPRYSLFDGPPDAAIPPQRPITARPSLVSSASFVAQDAELFLFTGETTTAIATEAKRYAADAADWGPEDFAIGARESVCSARRPTRWRAAILAENPADLLCLLESLYDAAVAGVTLDGPRVWLNAPTAPPRIAFLFPGISEQAASAGGVWAQRFVESRRILRQVKSANGDGAAVSAAFAAWQVLERCNVIADTALADAEGHLLALTWAGAVDEEDLLHLTAACIDPVTFTEALSAFAFDLPTRELISSQTGAAIEPEPDVRMLLRQQFAPGEALDSAIRQTDADLLIEIGPATPLATMARAAGRRCIAVDAHGGSLAGLLTALASAFALGAPVNAAALYEDRQLPATAACATA